MLVETGHNEHAVQCARHGGFVTFFGTVARVLERIEASGWRRQNDEWICPACVNLEVAASGASASRPPASTDPRERETIPPPSGDAERSADAKAERRGR